MKTALLLFYLVATVNVNAQQECDSCEIEKMKEMCWSCDGQSANRIVKKADEHFYAGNYKKALNYYERALFLRSNDVYVQLQVQRMKVYIEKRW